MKSNELAILSSIVLFDLITKLVANYYLPFQENVAVFGDSISLYLTYNQGSTGGQADFIIAGEDNKNLTIILTCISGLILLAYFLFIRTKELKIIYKILIGLVLFFTLSISMEVVRSAFLNVTFPSWITSVFGKLTGLALYGTLFYLSKDRWIRFFALIILGCGLGNLLSHFYLPYRVIDFININGTYDLLRIGVFNFADVAFDLGAIGLFISLVIFLLKKVTGNKLKSIQSK